MAGQRTKWTTWHALQVGQQTDLIICHLQTDHPLIVAFLVTTSGSSNCVGRSFRLNQIDEVPVSNFVIKGCSKVGRRASRPTLLTPFWAWNRLWEWENLRLIIFLSHVFSKGYSKASRRASRPNLRTPFLAWNRRIKKSSLAVQPCTIVDLCGVTLQCWIEATLLLFGKCLLIGSCHVHKYEAWVLFGSIDFYNEPWNEPWISEPWV